jgi:hypothetical protein
MWPSNLELETPKLWAKINLFFLSWLSQEFHCSDGELTNIRTYFRVSWETELIYGKHLAQSQADGNYYTSVWEETGPKQGGVADA